MGSMINLPPQPRKRSQRRCLRGQPLPLLRATLRTKQEIAKPTRQTVAKPAPGQHGWCVLVAARTTWGRCKPTCRAVFCHSKRRKPACHPWHFAILDGVWQESGGGGSPFPKVQRRARCRSFPHRRGRSPCSAKSFAPSQHRSRSMATLQCQPGGCRPASQQCSQPKKRKGSRQKTAARAGLHFPPGCSRGHQHTPTGVYFPSSVSSSLL